MRQSLIQEIIVSLYQKFKAVADASPQKIAFTTVSNNLTYANILEMVDLFDLNLRRHIGPGIKRIAFTSGKSEFYVIMMLIASRSSHRLILSSGVDADSAGVEYDYLVSEIQNTGGSDPRRIVIDATWFQPSQDTDSLHAFRPVEGKAEFVFRTTGSTGQGMFYPVAECAFIDGLEIASVIYSGSYFNSRYFSSPSPSMRWSQGVTFRCLLDGGTIVALPGEKARLLQLLDQNSVSTIACPPGFAAKLLTVKNVGQYLSRVQHFVLAGAFVPPSLMKRLSEVTNAKISVSYGSTETIGVTHYEYDPDKDYPSGYLGELMDQEFDIVFFDPDTKKMTDKNEGLIGVRHPKIILADAYLNTKGRLRNEAFIDGYFVPGDLVRHDGDTFIHLGRISNIVNVGGNKISLDLIEGALIKHPVFNQVCALAQMHDDGIERLVLAYIADHEMTLDEIAGYLPAKMRPISISAVYKFEEFPLNANDKVDRPALLTSISLRKG